MTDRAYCPTCKTEQPLRDREGLGEIEYNYYPKECTACSREFTVEGYTWVKIN